MTWDGSTSPRCRVLRAGHRPCLDMPDLSRVKDAWVEGAPLPPSPYRALLQAGDRRRSMR